MQWEGFCFVLVFWIFVLLVFCSLCALNPGLWLLDTPALQPVTLQPHCHLTKIQNVFIHQLFLEVRLLLPQAVSEGDSSSSLLSDSNPPNPNSVYLQSSEALRVAALSHKALGTETKVHHLPKLLQKFSTNPVSRSGLLPTISENKHLGKSIKWVINTLWFL